MPIDPSGVAIDSYAGGHIIVDVAGYFTGPSSPSSNAGLFVPTSPPHRTDTRESNVQIAAHGFRRFGARGLAVVANFTITRSVGPGWVAAVPAGQAAGTSTVNASFAGEDAANLGIITTADNDVDVWTWSTTDVIMDAAGYFRTEGPIPPSATIEATGKVALAGIATLSAVPRP